MVSIQFKTNKLQQQHQIPQAQSLILSSFLIPQSPSHIFLISQSNLIHIYCPSPTCKLQLNSSSQTQKHYLISQMKSHTKNIHRKQHNNLHSKNLPNSRLNDVLRSIFPLPHILSQLFQSSSYLLAKPDNIRQQKQSNTFPVEKTKDSENKIPHDRIDGNRSARVDQEMTDKKILSNNDKDSAAQHFNRNKGSMQIVKFNNKVIILQNKNAITAQQNQKSFTDKNCKVIAEETPKTVLKQLIFQQQKQALLQLKWIIEQLNSNPFYLQPLNIKTNQYAASHRKNSVNSNGSLSIDLIQQNRRHIKYLPRINKWCLFIEFEQPLMSVNEKINLNSIHSPALNNKAFSQEELIQIVNGLSFLYQKYQSAQANKLTTQDYQIYEHKIKSKFDNPSHTTSELLNNIFIMKKGSIKIALPGLLHPARSNPSDSSLNPQISSNYDKNSTDFSYFLLQILLQIKKYQIKNPHKIIQRLNAINYQTFAMKQLKIYLLQKCTYHSSFQNISVNKFTLINYDQTAQNIIQFKRQLHTLSKQKQNLQFPSVRSLKSRNQSSEQDLMNTDLDNKFLSQESKEVTQQQKIASYKIQKVLSEEKIVSGLKEENGQQFKKLKSQRQYQEQSESKTKKQLHRDQNKKWLSLHQMASNKFVQSVQQDQHSYILETNSFSPSKTSPQRANFNVKPSNWHLDNLAVLNNINLSPTPFQFDISQEVSQELDNSCSNNNQTFEQQQNMSSLFKSGSLSRRSKQNKNSVILQVEEQLMAAYGRSMRKSIQRSVERSDIIDLSLSQCRDDIIQYKEVLQPQTGIKYCGQLKNGIKQGKGTIYYSDGGYYEGEWKDNQIQGFGKLFYPSNNLAYAGYWRSGCFHGPGLVVNQDVQIVQLFDYTDFSNLGKTWVSYRGNFNMDLRDGSGIVKLSNGESISGLWQSNNLNGQGQYKRKNGTIIKGVWKMNKLQKIISQTEGA